MCPKRIGRGAQQGILILLPCPAATVYEYCNRTQVDLVKDCRSIDRFFLFTKKAFQNRIESYFHRGGSTNTWTPSQTCIQFRQCPHK